MEMAEPDVAARLAGLFARWDSASAPGLAVGIRHRGDVIFRRAYGMASLEARRALTPRSRIRIGSTSKHMTALLALLLAEDGLIDLDAPLRTWLPELTGPEGEGTLRQHGQHRAGGRCYFDLSVIAHLDAIPPAGRALDLARRQTGRNFAPGSAMIYCNSSYHLMALAIERAAGAPFETLLRDRLFAPLGMHDTASIPDDRDIVPGMATLHVPAPRGGWRRGLFPNPDVRGEGAVVSTIDDMLIWSAHLLSRDRFGSAESWRQLLERPVYPDGATGKYALGLIHGEHRGRAVIYHAGGVIGGLSQMLIFPDDGLEIVILANGAPEADPAALALAAADIVLGEDAEASPPAPAPAALTGNWASHATGMIYHLAADEAGLRMGVVGGPPVVPLTPGNGGTWTAQPPTLSPLEIDTAALTKGAITIRFGGETAPYHQRRDGERPGRLPDRLLAAPDAEAEARFERTAERDLLHVSDPFGTNTMALDWHDHRIALATATKPGLPYTAAILLDADGAAFTLNTARTRWLRFT
jgi:CubicO group peptidase (beta-lactamase class C family)